jgi:hypothetical protein
LPFCPALPPAAARPLLHRAGPAAPPPLPSGHFSLVLIRAEEPDAGGLARRHAAAGRTVLLTYLTYKAALEDLIADIWDAGGDIRAFPAPQQSSLLRDLAPGRPPAG